MLLWVYIIPGLWEGVPAERMLGALAGVAAALGLVTEGPRVAGFGRLAQGAALAQAEGLADALLALDCVCIQCDELVGPDVALERVAVLCGAAGHGWAEFLCALAVALQVEGAVPVWGVWCQKKAEGGWLREVCWCWRSAGRYRCALLHCSSPRLGLLALDKLRRGKPYLFFTLGGLQAHSSGCHCVAPAALQQSALSLCLLRRAAAH